MCSSKSAEFGSLGVSGNPPPPPLFLHMAQFCGMANILGAVFMLRVEATLQQGVVLYGAQPLPLMQRMFPPDSAWPKLTVLMTVVMMIYILVRLLCDIKLFIAWCLFKVRGGFKGSVDDDTTSPSSTSDLVVLDLNEPLIKSTAGECLHHASCARIKSVAEHRRTQLRLCLHCIPKIGAKGKNE